MTWGPMGVAGPPGTISSPPPSAGVAGLTGAGSTGARIAGGPAGWDAAGAGSTGAGAPAVAPAEGPR